MTFVNNAADLRKQPQDYGFDKWRRGEYPVWAGTWEAEQFANINEGIAEILVALEAATGTAKTAKRVECEAAQSGGRKPVTPKEPTP